MIKIYKDVGTARRCLLCRRTVWESDNVPERLRAGIREVFGEDLTPAEATTRVLEDVSRRGDAALCHWSRLLDHVAITEFEVLPSEWETAHARLPADLMEALELAASRIEEFHGRQPFASWETEALGGSMGQRVAPLSRVGVYVPGGTAPLPSSLLMCVLPARIAGVAEVIVCTPPGVDGRVADVLLAAAQIAGVDRLFRVGGAQAIGAMAFGTESIPSVDKVVGAGGLFTTLAKGQVYGSVGVDGLYGPTETVIVADESAHPDWLAADLLAQAEHDVLATAILLTPSRALAEKVQDIVQQRVACLERRDIVEVSFAGQGGIVVTPDLATAIQLADEFAPEHLCLSVREPAAWAERVHHAGGLFLGEGSCEVLGDYVAGPSHLMPTGGTARFASPVNVLDFLKITSIVRLDPETARALSAPAARLARAESLTGHAAAAEARGINRGPWAETRSEGVRSVTSAQGSVSTDSA